MYSGSPGSRDASMGLRFASEPHIHPLPPSCEKRQWRMETVPCSGVSFALKPLVIAVSMKPGEQVEEVMLGCLATRI